MGICNPKEPQSSVDDDDDDEKKYKKLLLLGAGWSGKSTVFKQMKVTYGQGFSDEERKSLRWTIYQNVYQAMKTLCEENRGEVYGKNNPELAADQEILIFVYLDLFDLNHRHLEDIRILFVSRFEA